MSRLLLALPQTWEDPKYIHPDTGAGGDNDPVDVLQINDMPCEVGDVMSVRVLGTLALVDGGETDWKLIVARNGDPKTDHMMDIDDVGSAARSLPPQTLSLMRNLLRGRGRLDWVWGLSGKWRLPKLLTQKRSGCWAHPNRCQWRRYRSYGSGSVTTRLRRGRGRMSSGWTRRPCRASMPRPLSRRHMRCESC